GEEKFGFAQAVGGGTPKGAEIGSGVNFSPTDESFSWLQGVRYTFKGRVLVAAELFGNRPTQASAAQNGSPGEIVLTSESWLGREPTIEECRTELRGRRVSDPDNGC
ncbi:MAG: hypothetical protein KGQ59_00330, partial [Bdellovibrionales bacterium]|nr:hypothetical protein [Bdellovibrionales bacterium]